MPSARLTKSDREALLNKIRNGYGLESAGASLGLSEAQIELARGKYRVEVDEAFSIATSRINDLALGKAISDNNAAPLVKMLERRERQTDKDNADPITLIEMVILEGCCVHCGAAAG